MGLIILLWDVDKDCTFKKIFYKNDYKKWSGKVYLISINISSYSKLELVASRLA